MSLVYVFIDQDGGDQTGAADTATHPLLPDAYTHISPCGDGWWDALPDEGATATVQDGELVVEVNPRAVTR